MTQAVPSLLCRILHTVLMNTPQSINVEKEMQQKFLYFSQLRGKCNLKSWLSFSSFSRNENCWISVLRRGLTRVALVKFQGKMKFIHKICIYLHSNSVKWYKYAEHSCLPSSDFFFFLSRLFWTKWWSSLNWVIVNFEWLDCALWRNRTLFLSIFTLFSEWFHMTKV